MNNFLISGSGRTGTRFLSTIMGRSKIWKVFHEPYPKGIENNELKDLELVQNIFNKDYYGEVNSMRRLIFFDLKVNKRGIMVRNPYNVWISIVNWVNTANKNPDDQKWVNEFNKSMQITDKAINEGIFPIIFEKLTTNIDYCNKVLNYFDINDVELSENDIKTKINSTIEDKIKIIENKEIIKTCEWFLKRHICLIKMI